MRSELLYGQRERWAVRVGWCRPPAVRLVALYLLGRQARTAVVSTGAIGQLDPRHEI